MTGIVEMVNSLSFFVLHIDMFGTDKQVCPWHPRDGVYTTVYMIHIK